MQDRWPTGPNLEIQRQTLTAPDGTSTYLYEAVLRQPGNATEVESGLQVPVEQTTILGTLQRITPYWYPDSQLTEWIHQNGGPQENVWKTRNQAQQALQQVLDRNNQQVQEAQNRAVERLLDF